MFFYILLFLTFSVGMYYSSFISGTYYNFKNNYTRMRSLTNTIPGIKVNVFGLLYTSMKIVGSLVFVYLTQNIDKTVKCIGFNHYEITYIIKGKVYKLRVKPTRLSKLLQVINDKNEDVTREIEPYLGPGEKFHGRDYKPRDFKQKTLTFNMSDGKILEFGNDEYIKLN